MATEDKTNFFQCNEIEKTLEALESGYAVDPRCLKALARVSKGDHECEITFEGGDGDNLDKRYNDCTKNPGHPNFIPVSDFKIEHLPPFYRKEKIMKSIQYWANLTVRILVRYVSENRPDTYPDSQVPYPYCRLRRSKRVRRFGTGNIFGVALNEDSVKGEVCPCHICEKLEFEDREKIFWTVKVETSKHVIYDASEAKCSIFECFYDSDSTRSETVKILYGYGMNQKESKIEEDLCQVFCVTHDKELVEKLKAMVGDHSLTLIPQYKKGLGVLVSHPHGCSKRVTVGQILHWTVPVGWDYPAGVPIPCDDTFACRLPLFPWSRMPDSNNDPLLRVLHPQNPKKPSSDALEIFDPLDEDPKNFIPKPGTQILLPLGTTFTLPKDAKYAFQFTRQDSIYFTFPPGTKFTLRDGQDIFFPPEAEFFCYIFSARVSFISYRVDSCEGSSGAALLQDGGHGIICCTFPHSGKDHLTKDANRSGLQCYTILPKSVSSGTQSDLSDSLSAPIMPQYVRFQLLGD